MAKSTTDDFELQARFAGRAGQRIVSIADGVAMRVAGTASALPQTVDEGMDDGSTARR